MLSKQIPTYASFCKIFPDDVLISILSGLNPRITPVLETPQKGISLNFILNSLKRLKIKFSSFILISEGMIEFISSFFTRITGKFEKGSFKELPVSRNASNFAYLSFIFTETLQNDFSHTCFPKNLFIISIMVYAKTVEIIKTNGEILKYTTPFLTSIPFGLKISHIAKFNPEKEKLIRQKQIKDFIKFEFLIPNVVITIEIAIKILIAKDTKLFCSGKNIYTEYKEPKMAPNRILFLFGCK